MRTLLLLGAAAFSIAGGCQTFGVWSRLPGVHLGRIAGEVNQQVRRPAKAQEALVVANLGSMFTAALRDPRVREGNRDRAQGMVSRLTHTQIGRLQQAAFLMLDLERAGTPPAQWWPTLGPLLTGLDRATFPHHVNEWIEHYTAVLQSEPVGMGPGSARVSAQATIRHPHGPFLQFFTERLRRVADARRDAGDQSALICRRVSRRLLREWTLEPGPIGLRLLAADLLAESLGASGATGDDELAKDLRAWRARYREQAATRPMPIPPLSLRRAPEPCPAQYTRLVNSLALLVWTAAATLAAALLTVCGLAFCFRAALTLRLRPWWYPAAVGIAVLVVGIGLALALGAPQVTVDDLRRWGSEELRWPVLPFAAAGLTVVLLALAVLWPVAAGGQRKARLARLTVVSVTTWLTLVVGLCLVAWAAGHSLAEYEFSLSGAMRDEYQAMTGTSGAELLQSLRDWNPSTAAGP